MARGKKGPRPEAREDSNVAVEENPIPPTIDQAIRFHCDGCNVADMTYDEIVEHASATGHEYSPGETHNEQDEEPIEEQGALFSEGIVVRMMDKPLSESYLTDVRAALCTAFQARLTIEGEKKAADEEFSRRIKVEDSRMRAFAAELAHPFQEVDVECEWRVIPGENARGLFRMDTNECIEKRALSAEDRAAELEAAAESNGGGTTINENDIPF